MPVSTGLVSSRDAEPATLSAVETNASTGSVVVEYDASRHSSHDVLGFLNDIGLVIGDISGKGIAAALLMASLHASLRSQCAFAVDQPQRLLRSVNQFFHEMSRALEATNGHYAHFAGDGLMALYGLNARDPAIGAADALRGAREMLARVDQLNSRLKGDLHQPLRIGIGIHFGEAIVGAMGPPGSQIISAIGESVNTCARLEGLTKEYDCRVIVSRRAAETAGVDVKDRKLLRASVRGLAKPVEFYTLDTPDDLRG